LLLKLALLHLPPIYKNMEYSKLISVTGMSGLYELVSSKSDGALVRSIEDKVTKFASNRTHNFSHLESIEVYTTRENVNLVEVFKAMEASAEALPNEKDPKLVKDYFKKVFDKMDFDRVYDSDRKKMVKWFTILKKNEVEFKLTAAAEEVEEIEETK
jgi:Domain of unknown function (DUF5606)